MQRANFREFLPAACTERPLRSCVAPASRSLSLFLSLATILSLPPPLPPSLPLSQPLSLRRSPPVTRSLSPSLSPGLSPSTSGRRKFLSDALHLYSCVYPPQRTPSIYTRVYTSPRWGDRLHSPSPPPPELVSLLLWSRSEVSHSWRVKPVIDSCSVPGGRVGTRQDGVCFTKDAKKSWT